jgi:hypothetical protein
MTTAFQANAFQVNAFQIDTGPLPVVDIDGHDGKRFQDRLDEERRKREARRNDIIAAYELLVEDRPQVAAEVAEPFVNASALVSEMEGQAPARTQVNWTAVLDRVDAVDRLWSAFLEMDDEDILVMM